MALCRIASGKGTLPRSGQPALVQPALRPHLRRWPNGSSAAISAEDVGEFSRVTPFQGLIFKAFNENADPAAVFSDVALQDNLDGEAILWAAERLAARQEKTKLLISISDGLPQAHLANTGELERHLLTACKVIEAKEHEGMILFGIGIGEKRVRQFYKNADVLGSVGDLP